MMSDQQSQRSLVKRETQLPLTSVQSVEKSPHRLEIFLKLTSGWAPIRLAIHLTKRYGAMVPVGDIEAYCSQIPVDQFLGLSEFARRSGDGRPLDIDAIVEMQRVLRVMETRAEDALTFEQVGTTGEATEAARAASRGVTSKRLQQYWEALRDYVMLLKELGEIGGQEDGDHPMSSVEKPTKIRELIARQQEVRMIMERDADPVGEVVDAA
jgi:hypothetical protein